MIKALSKSLLFPLTLIAALFVLLGCGNSTTPNRSDFVPIRPDPAKTPIDASAHKPPLNTPPSDVSNPASLNNYTHFTNRFSINYPHNWQFFERPDGVVFVKPDNQAGYSLFFYDVGQSYSTQELNQYLATFVAENFVKKGTEFTAINQEQKTDGSVVAQFSSLDPTLGPAINEVQVQQHDTIVFISLISANEKQWTVSYNTLRDLTDSFTPLDTTPLVDTPATGEPPVWVLIGSTSNTFGFLFPSNWEILHQDETSVSVAIPDSQIIFTASSFDWPETDNNSEAAQEAALAYLETISKKSKEIQSQPLTEFPLDTLSGATIDFLYTTEDDIQMASSVITAANHGKMYQIIFTSPAELYGGALQWFNPMYKSFKILSPEEFVVDQK